MKTNPLNQLAELGQSIWYDNIQRNLLQNGELAQMIEEDSLTGLTSNPSIFDKAIAHSTDYDEAITEMLHKDNQAEAITIYESLAISDIQHAADLMKPVYTRTNGVDGYVSLEVSPKLADDTEASVEEARRLFSTVNRPNLMIKIPATPAGLPAISTLIGEGINVNVTLMFSLQHYDAVAEAYIAGLETLDKSGGDLSKVASVASFFVSRVDTIFDTALDDIGTGEALKLRGKMGVANAKAAYKRFQVTFDDDRFQALAAKGARVQRPLWASTSTKNPAYSDVLYIEQLIGPNTVNTIPPSTLVKFKDHGQAALTLTQDVDEALAVIDQIKMLGVDYSALTETLQAEGVAAFAKSFESLLSSLEAKRKEILVAA